MKPAARLTDATAHGGTVIGMATKTLIGGKLAARKGDPHICPIHGGGVITGGSASVLIEGKQAARMTDLCGCALPGASGAGSPPALGPGGASAAGPDDIYPGGPFTAKPKVASTDDKGRTSEEILEQDGYHGPHAEATCTDSDGDGTRDTAHAEAGLARGKGEVESPELLGFKVRAEGEYEGARADGDAHASTGDMETGEEGLGGGAGAEVEGHVGKGKGEVEVVTPFGSASYDAEGRVIGGSAKADGFIGDDGTRIGIGGEVKAEADLVSGKGSIPGPITPPDFSIPIPFTGWSVDLESNAGVGYGGGGANVDGGIYYDRKDKRGHIQGGAGGEFGIGFDFDFDLSIGPATKPGGGSGGGSPSGGPAGGIPNLIVTGESSVLIGD